MSNYIPIVPPLWLMSSNNWKRSLPLPHCELPWLSFQNGQAVGTSNQIHKKTWSFLHPPTVSKLIMSILPHISIYGKRC